MFKFIKSLLGETTPTKSNQREQDVSKKINSEYRMKYGPSYDRVYNYDDSIARWIALKEVSKYAMDWLAESIQKGVEIEFPAISFSVEKGLPYLCDTEEETWLFEKEENPLQGSTEGIYNALLKYKYGSTANENKMNYWINQLLSLAANGNMMARGFICWRCGMVLSDGKYDGVLPQNVWSELKEKYENQVVASCNSGDANAQLAVAKYNRDITDDEKENLYLSSIEKGLSDACYYYAKFLDQKRFVANGMTVNMPPYGTTEWQEYMRVELSLYKKGAELDNGIMAGYCQYRLGDMYANGDGGVFKDAATAQIWFRKAYNNGYENARLYIDN